MSDVVGDTKSRFGREYIYLNPPSDSGLPTLGTWRLREDDNGTPPVGGGGGGGTVDLSQNGTAGEAITAGQLLRTNGTGQLVLASAASISTANVIGVATNRCFRWRRQLHTEHGGRLLHLWLDCGW